MGFIFYSSTIYQFYHYAVLGMLPFSLFFHNWKQVFCLRWMKAVLYLIILRRRELHWKKQTGCCGK